jgi:lipopolysaccharide transport system ATP-binding protein
MSDIVISVENLSKQYRLGTIGGRTVRADLSRWWAKQRGQPDPFLKIGERDPGHRQGEILWALQDVNFEVKQGEVVGIIGRNGAGKSTLLKILSRVTSPTTGRVKVKGRIASLLEVGTGFHPELTGRENIYLNGAILGMKKAEIDQKFDEIVDFSGVELFIDTPVKRYSSGMYVRLAFAVAAHLDPEVLVVDEVLAVGDVEFQKKCLGKMDEVAHEGRTVFFVSHQMAAVENLCERGILLEGGQINFIGSQTGAITQYLTNLSNSRIDLRYRTDRRGSGEIKIVNIQFRAITGNPTSSVVCGQDVDIYLHFEAVQNFNNSRLVASLQVKSQMDVPVFLHHSRLTGNKFEELPINGVFVCRIKKLPLPPAVYRITYSLIVDGEYIDSLNDAAELTVVGSNFLGSEEVPPISHGVCLVEGNWRVESYASN